MSQAIKDVILGAGQVNAKYNTRDDLLHTLARQSQSERRVVVLDEFPYLIAADPSTSSILQRIWDHAMKNSQIVLILNGSYIGRMEETVLGYPAPLSGRRTVQYLLEPLGSIWPLSDLHAKLAANYIIGNYNLPTDIRKRIAHHIQYMKRQYINSRLL